MSSGREFMHKTRYRFLETSPQQRGLPQPPLELGYSEDDTVVDLPPPDALPIPPHDLTAAIQNRRSVRRYSGVPLTPEELSYLLWCTQGVKEVIDTHATLRTVPSAGARHAIETYLLLNRVEDLAPGLYRFAAIAHKLVVVDLSDGADDRITAAAMNQVFVRRSAVTFIWTALAERMTWRYGPRGYRYLHLDAGHICQNLYLAAEGIGAGVCAIAAFEDDALSDALGIDGEAHFPIYMAALGKKPT